MPKTEKTKKRRKEEDVKSKKLLVRSKSPLKPEPLPHTYHQHFALKISPDQKEYEIDLKCPFPVGKVELRYGYAMMTEMRPSYISYNSYRVCSSDLFPNNEVLFVMGNVQFYDQRQRYVAYGSEYTTACEHIYPEPKEIDRKATLTIDNYQNLDEGTIYLNLIYYLEHSPMSLF